MPICMRAGLQSTTASDSSVISEPTGKGMKEDMLYDKLLVITKEQLGC